MCPVIDFIQRSIVFINVCLPNFDYFSLNISVCTETEHQGNRYPAARNSASPPETFTQWLNTPGTVTILQGVAGVTPVLVAVVEDLGINLVPLSINAHASNAQRLKAVTRVSVHSDNLSTTRHCSQANECELRWKWRKCGDFGLYNLTVIQSQIGTLNKYKRSFH